MKIKDTLNLIGIVFFLLVGTVMQACGGDGSGDKTEMFQDADLDGFGDADNTKKFSTKELTVTDEDGTVYVADNTDCNDSDASISPGGMEDQCLDGIDQNCDGVDEGAADCGTVVDTDNDADGYFVIAGNDCNDGDATIHPGATDTPDNGIDEDCDGVDNHVDPEDPDADADGYTVVAGKDCNDADAAVHPGATETANNGIDEDCDGADSDADADGDGYTVGGGDCNDADATVHPGAKDCEAYTSLSLELGGDKIDNDCDGDIDEESSCSGGILSPGQIVPPGGIGSIIGGIGAGDGGDGIALIPLPTKPITTTTTTTPYINKIKATVKNLDVTGAGVTETWFDAITFGVKFNDGSSFAGCTMDGLNVDRPDGLANNNDSDSFTVDLLSEAGKKCLKDKNGNQLESSAYETTLQLDNIKQIYLEAGDAATSWGIETIKFTAKYSESSTSDVVFYNNEGVWAYVGNSSHAENHYPKPPDQDSCMYTGLYTGFDNYDSSIGEVNFDGLNYDIPSFPKATLSFTPSDFWVYLYFKTDNDLWDASVDDIEIRFMHCEDMVKVAGSESDDFLNLFIIPTQNTSKYMKFYTPAGGTNGGEFEEFTLEFDANKYEFQEMTMLAHQAWNSSSSTGTLYEYKLADHGGFLEGENQTKALTATVKTESFP